MEFQSFGCLCLLPCIESWPDPVRSLLSLAVGFDAMNIHHENTRALLGVPPMLHGPVQITSTRRRTITEGACLTVWVDVGDG